MRYTEDVSDITITRTVSGMGTNGTVTSQLVFSIPYSVYMTLQPAAAAEVMLRITRTENGQESDITSPKSKWYIDGRTIDGGKVTFTCYDRMAFKDSIKLNEQFAAGTEFITIGSLLPVIQRQMGLSGINIPGVIGTEIKFPVTSIETRSCGDILSDISNILCCYFFIDSENRLCAVSVGDSISSDTITDYTDLKNVFRYEIKCCELTDSAGKVYSAGTGTSGVDTIQNSCGNISGIELTKQAQEQVDRSQIDRKAYTAWKIEKAVVSRLIDPGTLILPYGNDSENTLIANNISLKINSCGIIASLGAESISGGEIGKYMGRLSRAAENAIKSGDRLGKHLLVTRYQEPVWVDGEDGE